MTLPKQELALLGGPKAFTHEVAPYNVIGEEEIQAVNEVMRSGVLSQFLGCWHDDFYGGPKVREFESRCEDYFGVKHAITVNSWTSGLITAIGSLDIEPGDEVIVSPWTMSASATAILHWNAIPIFADIEADTFNIDPQWVEKQITPRTKAIMAVDIFGHSADIDSLKVIADKHNLKIISDTAQSPGAYYKGKPAGTLADIGGYSLNYHKHIHTGEGGILVTNNAELADRMRLIRNHAEAVIADKSAAENKGAARLNNMVGYNFRLGEIESAIGIEQLNKLSSYVATRQKLAERLTDSLSDLRGLQTPIVKTSCTHAYYVYPMQLDVKQLGCSRDLIAKALASEGVNLMTRYQNLHLLPMYQKKIAFGSSGFPWNSPYCQRDINYQKGICPVAETMNDSTFLGLGLCVYDFSEQDINAIASTFQKVWSNLHKLRE